MYAFCPECKNRVIDHGRGGTLRCPICHHRFPSKPMPSQLIDSVPIQDPDKLNIDKDAEHYYYIQYGEPIRKREIIHSSPNVEVEYDQGHAHRDETMTAQPPPPPPTPPPYGTPVGYPQYQQYPQYPQYPPPAYYQPQPGAGQPQGQDDLMKIFASFFAMIGLFCFFTLYFFSLISLGPAVVMVVPEMMDASPILIMPVFFPPFVIAIGFIPAGYAAVVYFLFIVAAILLSFAWMVYTEGNEAWHLIRTRTNLFLLPPFTTKNSFFLIPQLFLALLFLNVIVVVAFALLGISTPTPDSLGDETPLWELMYGLANASVWEEIATRVFFIGLPLGFLELLRRSSDGTKTYENYQFILGGNMKLGTPALLFILISSIMFGLAHVGAWDWWKFIPTFFSGLAFGYLFVVKGLHTAILLHFAFDYLSIPLDLFASPVVEIAFSLAMLFLIFLGMIFFIYFCIQAVVLVSKKINIAT